MTFFDACHDYFLYEKRDFCRCLAKSAEKYLSVSERKRYSRDFSRYAEDVMSVQRFPEANDPYWRLSKPQRECVQ